MQDLGVLTSYILFLSGSVDSLYSAVPFWLWAVFLLVVFLKSAFLLSIVNTFISCSMQEFFVKSADRVELMAFLGLFGAIVSACQMYPNVQSF